MIMPRILAINASAAILWAAMISAPSAQQCPPPLLHHVPPGFVLKQVAGAKQVRFPMFAAFDDRGRLFVAESSGLDLYKELSALTRKCRIVVLEDRDGDGSFESSSVFADKLVFPMGLVWRDGRLYVADPPDLVALEDTDGDGQADKRTVVLTGFGHKDNGSLHGLTFGPDGLLYMTMGSPDGYQLKRPGGEQLRGESGALLRCRPDGTDVEVVSRGFENLVEVVFTPRGDIIGTDNWFRNVNEKGSGGLRDALVHLLDGGLYPLQVIDKGTPQPVTGEPLGPIALYPAVALSGLVRYEGNAFPAAMHGNLFSAQHNARKVGRHVLVQSGTSFLSKDFDFLTSDDPDFHPSDVLVDGDGSLLIVDTGSWYIHHCPTGKIRQSPATGGIWRALAKNTKLVADPWGLKIAWQQLSVTQLAGLLGDDRAAVRERAGKELIGHGKAAVPALAALLNGPAEVAVKQQAVWTLSVIGTDEALTPLRQALTVAEPDLVATAARALGLRQDKKSAGALAQLLTAKQPFVLLAAAEALARCGTSSQLPSLWQALKKAPDRFLEHALIHAVHRLASTKDLQAALADPHPRIRKAALILLNQPPRPADALTHQAVLAGVAADDAELRSTAIKLLQQRPEWAEPSLDLIRSWLEKKSLTTEEVQGLRGCLVAFQSHPKLQTLVGDGLVNKSGKLAEAQRVLILEVMAECSLAKLPPSWLQGLNQLMTKSSPALRFQAVRTAAVLQIADIDPVLSALAESKDEPELLRLEALRAIVPRQPKLTPSAFALVLRLLAEDAEPLTRLAAGEIAGRSQLTDAQALKLLQTVRADPLLTPSQLSAALPKTLGPETASALTDYLSQSLERGWHPAEQDLKSVLARLPKSEQAKSDALLALWRKQAEGQQAKLAQYEPLLKGGDVERGKEVFFGKKAACSACHRIGDKGGAVGPDLTRVGAIRSGRDLLESIVVPAATFAQGYENYLVTTTSGQVFTGVIARKTPQAVVLRDSSGGEKLIASKSIDAMTPQKTSLMPDGLAAALTVAELRDLLAYLQALK